MTLESQIKKKAESRGRNSAPRTRHLNPDGSAKYTNRLFLEESPYLLQHAHNPVNWNPWGAEAFALARATNRPLFVSIGYATCHWCHVMEEESFEDEEIAEFLNTHFVPVKVDREERPDIDAIYMGAVQILTGGGGWPLNVFLMPDGKPFYGGTYFPARDGDRPPHTGFLTLLKRISEIYETEHEKILTSANQLTLTLNRMGNQRTSGALPDRAWVDKAIGIFAAGYDPTTGGSKGAPKFPSTFPVVLLLRAHQRTGVEAYRRMAEHTLTAMADGGIHDQAGGGFHRYSTDANWLVPHFEKMLYDNALLASAYVEGFLATGNPRFKKVAETTLDYLLREMEDPRGGFYSATDADSLTPQRDKEEGYFFTWSKEEIDAILPGDTWAPVLDHFNLTGPPQFEGRYIPHIQRPIDQTAKKHGIIPATLAAMVEKARPLMREARTQRKAPLTDDKRIAAWNGLAMAAFAQAGIAFGNADYIAAAERTAGFILERLIANGRLHRSRLDDLGPLGFLDDYTFVTAGLIDLYEATGKKRWIKAALEFQGDTDRLFAATNGGYYMTGTDNEALITREKPGHDGAIPSGNSMAAFNLFRLYTLTSDTAWLKKGLATVTAFIGAKKNPMPFSGMVSALDFHLESPQSLILVLPPSPGTQEKEALKTLAELYAPYTVTARVRQGSHQEEIVPLLPIFTKKPALHGNPTLYPCQNGTCRLPVSDPTQFKQAIFNTEDAPTPTEMERALPPLK